MDLKIKALRRITDAGHNIARGKTTSVRRALAQEWRSRGWAEIVPEKATKAENTAPVANEKTAE